MNRQRGRQLIRWFLSHQIMQQHRFFSRLRRKFLYKGLALVQPLFGSCVCCNYFDLDFWDRVCGRTIEVARKYVKLTGPKEDKFIKNADTLLVQLLVPLLLEEPLFLFDEDPPPRLAMTSPPRVKNVNNFSNMLPLSLQTGDCAK